VSVAKSDPPHHHRMCVVCRERAQKESLLRIVGKQKESNFLVVFDETGQSGGRGVYVHKDVSCVTKLIEVKKRLQRALRAEGMRFDEQRLLELQGYLLRKI
jgi:predicted RNA-binding protein YlxR (DUF448 family)